MKYSEFKERVGEPTVPTDEHIDTLLRAENSIHFCGVVILKAIALDEELRPDFTIMVETIELLERRGAVRGKDYIFTCSFVGRGYEMAVHSTHEFLCDEDFPLEIRRA